MEQTLRIINELERDGVIGRYAIGGAFGVMFYAEPVATFDLDIFCVLPQRGLLVDLGPLYAELAERGYLPEGEQVQIEGVPVQFLVPPSALVEEALREANNKVLFGVETRVFTYEHLLAIMVDTGRPKDKLRIVQCLQASLPDEFALQSILQRFDLLDRWAKIVE
jgi:hypothetical protein